MQIGLIGCGNMARALARGWGRPLVCADPIAERARDLSAEVGGQALASNAEVAERAELVVLCHKPAQLAAVAREIGPGATPVASILAATPLAALREAYPGRPVYRFIPSLPVEVRQGAIVQAASPGTLAADGARDQDAAALDAQVAELFAELGTLVVLDDALLDVATGLMSCAPAYVALVAEAQVDAGVRRGIPAAQGAQLVVQTLAGTAELLRRRDYDTMAVRREVSSPGGLTARGVDALERAGLRGAFSDALDAVLGDEASDAARERANANRRLPVDADLRVHADDHRVHRRAAAVRGRHTPSVLAHDRPGAGFLRDMVEPFLRIFRRLAPRLGWARLQPDAGNHRAVHRKHRGRPGHHQLSARRDRWGARPSFAWLRAALVLVGVVVLDQLTKRAVERSIIPGEERRFLPGCSSWTPATTAWPSGSYRATMWP